MKNHHKIKGSYFTSLAAVFLAGLFLTGTGTVNAETTDVTANTNAAQETVINDKQSVDAGSQADSADTTSNTSANATNSANTDSVNNNDQVPGTSSSVAGNVEVIPNDTQVPDVINDANVTSSDADKLSVSDLSQQTKAKPKTLVGKIASDIDDGITDVTTDLAAKVIFPIGFSRDGTNLYSKIQDKKNPDRYATSDAYGKLDQKYDPQTSQTFFDSAQNWWDNYAVKQELSIPSSNFPNETSRATYIASPNSKKTVIIGQGWTEHPDWIGVVSMIWYSMGYNVLMPSQRGQFSGDGDYIPFGYYDSQDWKNWVSQTDNLVGPDNQVIYYGQSMGAATALDAAADPNLPANVKAVIADCSFSSLAALGKSLYDKALEQVNEPLGKLPIPIKLDSIPLAPFDKTMTNVDKQNIKKQGFDLDDAEPIKAVTHITIPTYFITTEDDNFIPDSESVALYNASSAPIKKLWVLDGSVGGHAHAEAAVTEYKTNILGFLNEVDQANNASVKLA